MITRPALELIGFWALPALLQILELWNDVNPEYIVLAFIPVLNFLLTPVAIASIASRTIRSRGRCFWGHSFSLRRDSEAELWKDGRMPLRISMGGYDEYKCTKCFRRRTVKWSAF